MKQIDSLQADRKFKKTEIGEIPVDWEVREIGDICGVVGSSTQSPLVNEYWFQFFCIKLNKKKPKCPGSRNMFKEDSKKKIRSLKIPLPPLPEQRKIVEILTTFNVLIENKAEIIKKKDQLKRGIMQQLHTLSEQKKMATILAVIDNDIEKELDYKKKLDEIKQGLRQILLNGRVRVKK